MSCGRMLSLMEPISLIQGAEAVITASKWWPMSRKTRTTRLLFWKSGRSVHEL